MSSIGLGLGIGALETECMSNGRKEKRKAMTWCDFILMNEACGLKEMLWGYGLVKLVTVASQCGQYVEKEREEN